MSELVFDLVGPFVVQFRKGIADKPGTAYVYAPLCDNHHANILTDSDDVFVPGNGDSRKAKYVSTLLIVPRQREPRYTSC